MSELKRTKTSVSEISVAVWAWAPPGAACVTGTLTLPVAVSWGDSTFTQGEYAFVAPAAASPEWLYLEGPREAAVVFASSAERKAGAGQSEIKLVRAGNGFRVASLELRDLDLIFRFAAPSLKHGATSHARSNERDGRHRGIAAPAPPHEGPRS